MPENSSGSRNRDMPIPGRLIPVVGPSGVGKDTLMRALRQRRPDLHLVRRTITRPADAVGEDFDAVTEAEFQRRQRDGAFALCWQAHGHHYGIPGAVRAVLAEGRDALVNLSRGVLTEARAQFPDLHVLSLTASSDVLAARLAARGREDGTEIARRLARRTDPAPQDVPLTTIANDARLEAAVEAALDALYPASAIGSIR